MNNSEKRLWLIKYLLSEDGRYADIEIPQSAGEQFRLYRSLVNVRMPSPVSDEYLRIEDEYLSELNENKGITRLSDLTPVKEDVYIWQGDITSLACGAIVNAANSQLLGCFVPCHACIDNCIHTFSGVRLRKSCEEIMKKQGKPEATGRAKITPAYNLPCEYVIHTVGPIIFDKVREEDERLLASCYTECLKLADENEIESIAFCCISTGEFHFPNGRATEIAVKTVLDYKEKTKSKIKVIFNVFKDIDLEFYNRILK